VIDGCPAGLELSEQDLILDLKRRAPGQIHTSPRKEADTPQILSGVFEGKTTGAPISILIQNQDAESKPYDAIQNLIRPGHANSTYLAKYGIFDHRGGGRASARETACRVAAGAVAKKLLLHFGITARASLLNEEEIIAQLERLKLEGDSIGGIVEFTIEGLTPGLGDPVYEKLEANLAKAMLSLPATKGFEIDEGFKAAAMQGSEHNLTHTATLGGIATGLALTGRVAFKPTSSIKKPQATTTLDGQPATLQMSAEFRHDPCVAIRAVPVVEAMAALVIADALLLNRCARL
jgi:chorismate synthase